MSTTAPFQPATEKLSIGSTDDTSLQVTAQDNAKELQIDKSIPWQKVNQANQSNNTKKTGASAQKGIHLEFTGAEGRSMSVELLFDGYEKGSGLAVQGSIATLEQLASVIDPDSTDENKRRPHLCVVAWGQKGLPSFRCVIETLSTKYTMFSTDGEPLRATCTVKLKEADAVTLQKAK